MRLTYSLYLLLCFFCAQAQSDSVSNDTIALQYIQPVTVTAYGQSRNINEAPASISILNSKQLERFGNTNLLPAINTLPGVRMEERSPGSFRLNIRGSSLRSPFGVRNVKVYYNDIPISDPSGFTYLNQLGYYNIQQIEVIKGPASSLYGAGNGGVMILNSMPPLWTPGVTVGYSYGSYYQNNALIEAHVGNEGFKNVIRYQTLHSDGYRQHANMRKDILSWDAALKTGSKGILNITALYTDLYYQTPGALTLAEYEANPRGARPRIGATPGSVENKAAIHQKNVLGGFTYLYKFDNRWQHATTIYGSYTQFTNPTVRNYSDNIEPHYGGRTTVKYETLAGNSRIQWQAGAEVQQQIANIKTLTNNVGSAGILQTEDDVNSRQLLGFTQLTWHIHHWVFEGGLSVSNYKLGITRISNTPPIDYTTDMGMQLSPRLAMLYKAGNNTSIYANTARGFSTPTTAELSPSGSPINLSLQPEIGWNYETGVRGNMLGNRLSYDISAFYYNLSNAIVQRRDAAGGDTYINSGATDQFGIEGRIDYALIQNTSSFLQACNIWGSYTYYDFRYRNFIRETNDYSGKQLPGVAPNTAACGLDANFKHGLYINITYNYVDRIALNDGNTVHAAAYHLLVAKVGYTLLFGRYNMQLYTGIDNVLNQHYSLGNDINAAAGRYYNAAPGINYYAGIQLQYLSGKK